MKEEEPYRQKHWREIYRAQVLSRIFPPRIKKELEEIKIDPDPEMVEYLIERKSGNGLYLYGHCGSGKTLLAAAFCMKVLEVEYLARRMEPSEVKYVNVPEMLLQIQNTYTSKSGPTTAEIFDSYAKAKLLVMDDIGAERGTEWSGSVLNNLVNERYENLLPTIFTSNLDLEDLMERLGSDRIPSRIVKTCKLIHLCGDDRRITDRQKS